jgi:hypothetical protein
MPIGTNGAVYLLNAKVAFGNQAGQVFTPGNSFIDGSNDTVAAFSRGVSIALGLTVTQLASFYGGISVTGGIQLSGAVQALSGSFSTTLTTGTNAQIGGTLGVTGVSTFSTDVTLNAGTLTAPTGAFTTLSVSGTSSLGVLNTANAATLSDTLTVAGITQINNTLTVTGLGTFNNKVNISGDGNGLANDGATTLELKAITAATLGPSLAFHRPGYYATKIYLGTDNILHVGGWSAAADAGMLKARLIASGDSGQPGSIWVV